MRLVHVLHARRSSGAVLGASLAALFACSDATRLPTDPAANAAAAAIVCDGDDGGISLPPGFCATVFASGLGASRHMTLNKGGVLFVAVNDAPDGTPGGVIALRDADDDGHADQQVKFGDAGGNGVWWYKDWLYFAPNDRVVRYSIDRATLLPSGGPELVVGGLPNTGDHRSKTIVMDRYGMLYLNVGSASNSCQVENRVLHSPGVDPCPELPVRAGIWRFDGKVTGQSQSDGLHWGIGFRNTVALALRPEKDQLWGVQHGRDELHENWPEFFTEQDQSDLPSEELIEINRGDDNGWPYCFHDWKQDRKVLAPEYGGDGAIAGGCARREQPMEAFPGHWAPNALLFYTGTLFPARYRGGAFIAFHGSHDRLSGGQQGYNVVFVPFSGQRPAGGWEAFADDFVQSGGPLPASAKHRPTGLAQGPDGALYISDDAGGTIWKVVYVGSDAGGGG